MLYVPTITHNILSILAFSAEGYYFTFSNNGLDITLDGFLIGHGSLLNKLFKLDLNVDLFSLY